MAKRKSWFSFVKRFFVGDTQSKPEKKEKRRKWIFGIGRLKVKRLPSIAAPPTTQKETKQEVEKVNNGNQFHEETEELQVVVKSRIEAPHPTLQCQWKIQESSAIKIQAAYRGYLARKALRALKGIVKLQAIIRGRAVRRQTMSTLKCLQSLVDIQSQICAKRLQIVKGRWDYDENQETPSSRDKIIRMDSNSERRLDDSILLKEEKNASHMSKTEAEFKRERINEYAFHHRRSAESERKNVNGRWRYWMEQWVDTQLSKSKELEDLDSIFRSHYITDEEDIGGRRRQLHLRNIQSQRQNHIEGLYSPRLASVTRKPSHTHRRQPSLGNEESSSPSVLPTYMAATESARAKVRSSSSPKLRTVNVVDTTKVEENSPCKKKLSFVSSSTNQQRSPSLKGISGPIRSGRTMKDLSINSDSSFLYGYNRDWDGQGFFK